MNRVKEVIHPFDKDDPEIIAPDRIFYSYDEVGNLAEVSAPPSRGQSVRNVTRYAYFDNGWTRSSTDAWSITTNYDYNPLGQQTNRTFVSAGGGASRTMTWDYFPDGKLRSRSDDGVPVGKHVELVDNSDPDDTAIAGDWATIRSDGREHQGFDYRTHPGDSAEDSFTWKAFIPADGDYEVSVRYAAATATNATYTVEHDDGMATRQVDQTQQVGEWVSLGKYPFTEGTRRKVMLSGQADGTVVADAVRLVRDNSGDIDNELKTFSYRYDANGNLDRLTDSSPNARVDEYRIAHNQLNRATEVEELSDGAVGDTTTFGYDPNGNVLRWEHDDHGLVRLRLRTRLERQNRQAGHRGQPTHRGTRPAG